MLHVVLSVLNFRTCQLLVSNISCFLLYLKLHYVCFLKGKKKLLYSFVVPYCYMLLCPLVYGSSDAIT